MAHTVQLAQMVGAMMALPLPIWATVKSKLAVRAPGESHCSSVLYSVRASLMAALLALVITNSLILPEESRTTVAQSWPRPHRRADISSLHW